MNNFTFEELQNKLIAEEKLTIPYSAIMAENAMYRFEPAVREGVEKWLSGQLTRDFAVGEITLGDVLDELGGTLFQALCFMDVLMKDPERMNNGLWTVWRDHVYVD